MQFSFRKLCVQDERTLPSFISMFPGTTTSPTTSTILPMDASMTLGGLPPLQDAKVDNNISTATANITTDSANITTRNTNVLHAGDSSLEIVNAFASLDVEHDDETGRIKSTRSTLPLEFQCRYRQGKCSEPRTLKKNGSMHGYCDYHRQLSIRNQRVFDQKKRQRRQVETLESKQQPPDPRARRQSVTSGARLDDERDEKHARANTPRKSKRRRCRAS
ncbi:hypothetical protein PsorP6_010379 [Peronosclerospora sorghi]|uniref:Uncharacterized protein n=1 Tax=Peronosclerospora sorghi TaxID=230839 RepID=A0ACC0VUZ4_9STRA|nr:hypothetical protein PsorP6_010379 [Peronosclerospora sorghi]